jgi:hypothetical protein
MNNHRIQKLVLITLITLSASVFAAENENFTGLSAGIAVDLKSTTAKARPYGGAFQLDSLGQENTVANLSVDYGFKIKDKFILILGGSFDLSDSDIFKVSTSGYSYQAKEKNHYSLSLKPGYELNKDTLGYLKFSYHHSEFDESNNIGLKEYNKDLHGYGLGLGVRNKIFNRFYGNLEIERVMYSGDSIVSTDLGTGSTVGKIGLSYNFSNSANEISNSPEETINSNFKGLAISINGQLKSTTSKIAIENTDFTLDSFGKQNLIGNVSADYGFQLTNKITLLAGGSYDLGNTDIFAYSGSLAGFKFKFKEKDHFSLFIAPGYQLSEKTIGYVKFAYHRSTWSESSNWGELAEAIHDYTGGALSPHQKDYSKGLHGYGIGFGLRSQIYNNIYSTLEVQRVNYDKATISPFTIDSDSTIASVGLTYKF